MIESGKCSGKREHVAGVPGCGGDVAVVVMVVARQALGGKLRRNQRPPAGEEMHLHHLSLKSLKRDLQTHGPIHLENEYRLLQKSHQSKLTEFGDIVNSDAYGLGCEMKQI